MAHKSKSKTKEKKNIPRRSRGVPKKLAQKTCLRCSKRISDSPTLRCGYKDYQKCKACGKKHKSCDPVSILSHHHRAVIANRWSQVPRKFIPEVNHLFSLAHDLAPGTERHAIRVANLEEAQKLYTKRVQAYIRKREKRGLKHRPTTTVEVSLLSTHRRSMPLTTYTGGVADTESAREANRDSCSASRC
jgi:hypothetical protein